MPATAGGFRGDSSDLAEDLFIPATLFSQQLIIVIVVIHPPLWHWLFQHYLTAACPPIAFASSASENVTARPMLCAFVSLSALEDILNIQKFARWRGEL